VAGGFAGYYLGYDDGIENVYGDLSEEEMELVRSYKDKELALELFADSGHRW